MVTIGGALVDLAASKRRRYSAALMFDCVGWIVVRCCCHRWYLGIQSKKDPGHVMTEVYKAMYALGCTWYSMNNYRVLCNWRHVAEPSKVVLFGHDMI